jgi:hypothetical protein
VDELPGSYVADYGPWHGELQMKPNGIFLETVTPIGETNIVRKNGQWKLDPADQMVTLYWLQSVEDLSRAHDVQFHEITNNVEDLDVGRSGAAIIIGRNPFAEGFRYKKQR